MKIHNPLFFKAGLALLSGFLLVLTFPLFNLSILAWISLIPLLFALQGTTPRFSFWLGWLCGLAYFGGTLYWLVETMIIYGHIPLCQSLLIALALLFYLAIYTGLFAFLWAWLRSRIFFSPVLLAPIIWTSLEYLRAHLFTGFPWSILGYSQYQHTALIQFTDILGVYGISFLIILVNASLFSLLSPLGSLSISGLDRHPCHFQGAGFKVQGSRFRVIGSVLLLLCCLQGYGMFKLRYFPLSPQGSIAIGIIQGNIPQQEKWDDQLQDKIFKIYRSLTLQAAQQKAELIIWPESSVPCLYEVTGDTLAIISPLVQKAGASVMVGLPRLENTGKGRVALKNSAFFLSPQGKILDYYDKIHLVPFGEYLPFKKLLSHLGSVVNEVGEFSAGKKYTQFRINNWHFGLVICYEIIFPELIRQFIGEGTNFLVNITNDAWFGQGPAPYQHFSMAIFRALENGISIVRVANTGISGIIDPFGRVLIKTALNTRSVVVEELKITKRETFYSKCGDLYAQLCVACLGFLLMLGYRQNRRVKIEESRRK